MRRLRGIGLGLLFSGLMIETNSGATVESARGWSLLGLILMVLGVVLIVIGRSPKGQ